MDPGRYFRMSPYALPPLVGCLVLLTLAWLVMRRRRKGAPHAAFALMNLAIAFWNLDIFLLYTLKDLEAASWVERLSQPFIVSGPLLWVNFVTAFLRSPRRRLTVGLYLAWTAFLLPLSLSSRFVAGIVPMYFGWYGSAGPLYHLYVLTHLSALVLVTGMLGVHYRRQRDPVVRNQIGYFLLATVIMGLLSADNFFPLYGLERYPMGNIAVILYLVVVGLAIIRSRFMDLQTVVRQSLVYSIATFLLTALYLALILLLEGLVRIYLLPQSLFVPLLPALAAAFAFQGIKERVQSRLDVLYGHERRRTILLSAFARAAQAAPGRRELAAIFADTIGAALHPERQALFTRDADTGRWRAELAEGLAPADAARLAEGAMPAMAPGLREASDVAGDGPPAISGAAAAAAAGFSLAVPIGGRDGPAGACLLGPKASGRVFTGEDRVFLGALAGQMSAALEAREFYERWRREEKFTSLGRASATISHELRNPLNVIKGAVLYLRSRHRDGEVARFAEVVGQEVDRTACFVDQFLKAARIPPANRREMDVGPWLRSFSSSWASRSEGVEVAVSAPEGEVRARLDPILMEQALENLYRNGAEAMGGGGRLEVSLERRPGAAEGTGPGGETLVIAVADAGPGVPAEMRETVFDPFFTTKAGGTGLGLCVVDGVARAHGGRAEVDSPRGGGAVFRVFIPAAGEAPGRAPARAPANN